MKLIYIAGRYTAPTRLGVAQNTLAAIAVAREVTALGHFAVTPHVLGLHIEDAAGDEHWYAGTLELMRRCDAVVMVPGWESSKGAVAERWEAMERGIPVFESVDVLRRRDAEDALSRGECPDGGGPHCVCRLLGQERRCVNLRIDRLDSGAGEGGEG